MTQNSDTRSSYQPQYCSKGRCQEECRYCNNNESSVELRCRGTEGAKFEICATKLSYAPHATHDEEDEKKQVFVCKQGVNAEHSEDDGIVTGEVREIKIDPALNLAKIGRLRKAFDVEELGDGLEVCKSCGYRL